ncbi:MAG: PD40 domain-containing protein, partial [Armatimonadetes bacterium]|nr:PD40 domain-containing protein [Armatimonadota bacterium]
MAYLEPASSAICNESSTRPDRISGRPIVQLTSAASISHHIYPEAQSFTSDGSQTVFWRKRGPNGQPDLFMADLQHRTVRALTDEGAKGLGACIGPAVSPDEQWLYYVLARHDGNEMRRVSLKTLQRETLWDLPPGKPYVLGTISPDGRYYVTGFVEQNQPARVARVDLDTGDVRVIYSSPAVYNPHPVWDPSGSGWLLVQENTGYECGPHGHRLVDGLGARLLVMRADGSDVRQLSVGRRHDEWIQGHQTWLGRRGEVVATVVRQPSGG